MSAPAGARLNVRSIEVWNACCVAPHCPLAISCDPVIVPRSTVDPGSGDRVGVDDGAGDAAGDGDSWAPTGAANTATKASSVTPAIGLEPRRSIESSGLTASRSGDRRDGSRP